MTIQAPAQLRRIPSRVSPPRRSPAVDGLTQLQVARPAAHRQITVAEADSPRELPQDLPPPGPWCAALARAAVEIALGGRPAVQLVRWLEPEVYERLAKRGGLQYRINGNGVARKSIQVRAVRTCEIDGTNVEAAVAVWDGTRVRAVAMRVEARRTRWMAVELRIG